MLDFLKKIFRFKTKELEANLQPAPGSSHGGRAEVEVEFWSDGEMQIEASVKHSGLPDGTKLDVNCGGRTVATLTVMGGYAKQMVKPSPMSQPPAIDVGDQADMSSNGTVIYSGTFRRD